MGRQKPVFSHPNVKSEQSDIHAPNRVLESGSDLLQTSARHLKPCDREDCISIREEVENLRERLQEMPMLRSRIAAYQQELIEMKEKLNGKV